MRKVLFKKRDTWNGKNWVTGELKYEGVFHQWAVGFEEFEAGTGNYTYALIELADGTIEEVLPSDLKFIEPNKNQ